MPYIDLAGLSRYASRQKERLERDYALLRDMQWTRSEKAGAVSLWPAGGTQLDVSVDFLFTETPPASGDKGPENPSTITGVSEVTVKHRTSNLLYPLAVSSGTTRDVSWSSNGDGSFTFNGTASSNSDAVAGYWVLSDIPKGTYRIKMKGAEAGTHPRLVLRIDDNGTISYPAFTENSSSYVVFTVTDTKKITSLYFRFIEGYTFNNITVSPYLVLGDEGYDIPLSDSYTLPLGSTYYGGTLDVASGVMTVTWVGKVLDGTETIEKTSGYTNVGRYTISNIFGANQIEVNSSTNQFCTHYLYSGSNSDSSRDAFYVARSSGTAIIFSAANESKDDFVAWLAQQYSNGTPVKIVCKVDTPYTVQLDPVSISALVQSDKYTPRLNTVYTDAQAVQVGYVKSPIRDEYELQQAVIAQGGNV